GCPTGGGGPSKPFSPAFQVLHFTTSVILLPSFCPLQQGSVQIWQTMNLTFPIAPRGESSKFPGRPKLGYSGQPVPLAPKPALPSSTNGALYGPAPPYPT